MFFTMPCPNCGKPLKGRDDLVGRSARCPYCRSSVVVTKPAEGAARASTGNASGSRDEFAFDAKSSGPSVKASSATTPRGGAVAATSKGPAQAPPAAPWTASADTNVSGARALVAAILATALFYALLWPFSSIGGRQTYLGRLFIGASSLAAGGWVPIAEVFLFSWAAAMLVQKWFKIRRQQRGLLFDVLPTELGETIRLDTIDRFVSHIRSLPQEATGSFLVTRCLRGLEHFRVRKSAADTATMLASQSDIDASSVDASYTMFHVFIWAIPILGFLGTVIGVSNAVGGFTGTLEASGDIGGLKEGLRSITSGLGTAFDTTLVALTMAMLLTFPVSSLQKYEGDILGQIDEYTNENFLRRLDDGLEGGAERGIGGSRGEVAQAIDAALTPHRVHLEAWTKSVRSIGEDIAAQVKQGWEDVNAKLIEEHGRQASRVSEIDAMVATSREGLAQTVADVAAARHQAAETLKEAATSIRAYTSALERGIEALSSTLEKLGEERVIVEVHRPAGSWWNPFGSRSRS
jgi:hypothetical protein